MFSNRLTSEQFLNAARDGNLAIVQQYIEENYNNPEALNVTSINKFTALMLAACNGHATIVNALLVRPGINFNAADKNGNTALIWATNEGHINIVNALLEMPGIDVNATTQNNVTALMLAARNGNTTIVKALLGKPKININAANNYGFTALMLAAFYGHIAAVKALLNKPGTDVNAKNKNGKTAVEQAREKGYIEIANRIAGHKQATILSFSERLDLIKYEGEIPKHLQCPISLSIMNDPITLPGSGITYDRISLEEYFAKNGNSKTASLSLHIVRVSRTELDIATNITIKNLADDFVKEQENKAKAAIEKEQADAALSAAVTSTLSTTESSDSKQPELTSSTTTSSTQPLAEMTEIQRMRAARLRFFGQVVPRESGVSHVARADRS